MRSEQCASEKDTYATQTNSSKLKWSWIIRAFSYRADVFFWTAHFLKEAATHRLYNDAEKNWREWTERTDPSTMNADHYNHWVCVCLSHIYTLEGWAQNGGVGGVASIFQLSIHCISEYINYSPALKYWYGNHHPHKWRPTYRQSVLPFTVSLSSGIAASRFINAAQTLSI